MRLATALLAGSAVLGIALWWRAGAALVLDAAARFCG